MAGSVVVDASLAIAWVLQEVHTAAALACLARWEQHEVQRLVPGLFAVEAASVFLKNTRSGRLPPGSTRRALRGLMAGVTVIPDDHLLADRAAEIAETLMLRKVYDSLYAALAERERCEFWTGDERFFNSAQRRYPWVRWLGDG